MKKIFSILILLIAYSSSFGQSVGNDTTKYLNYKGNYGFRSPRYMADKVLQSPLDTIFSKDGLAHIGSNFYVGDGISWKPVNGGGVSVINIITNNSFSVCNFNSCDTILTTVFINRVTVTSDTTLEVCDTANVCETFTVPKTQFATALFDSTTIYLNFEDIRNYLADTSFTNQFEANHGVLADTLYDVNDSTFAVAYTDGTVKYHVKRFALTTENINSIVTILNYLDSLSRDTTFHTGALSNGNPFVTVTTDPVSDNDTVHYNFPHNNIALDSLAQYTADGGLKQIAISDLGITSGVTSVGNTGTGYALSTGSNIKRLGAGTDVLIDSTTTANTITIKADTTAGNTHLATQGDIINAAADGSETKVNAGIDITVSGTGTTGSPYVVNTDTTAGNLKLATQGDIINDRVNPIAGTNVTITGSYPNLTFNSSGGGGGGSGTVTKAQLPLIISATGDTVSRRFDVLDYIPVGVNPATTDVTVYVQAAITACVNAGGGDVMVPLGVFKLDGALQASNSQLYIPVTAFSSRVHVRLIGEGLPNFTPVGGALDAAGTTLPTTTGTILKSTISTGAARAAVIGTAQNSGAVNYVYLTVENLAIQVKNNPAGAGPVVGGINWRYGATLQVKNVTVYIDTSGYVSTLPTNDVAGIETPDNNSETLTGINNTVVVGFRNAYRIGEHVSLSQAQGWCNYNFITLKDGNHSSSAYRLGSFWNVNDVNVIAGSNLANFNIYDLDIEWKSSGKWFDNVYTVKDTANRWRGSVSYTIIAAGAGLVNSHFSQTGGTNVRCSPVATGTFQNKVATSLTPSNPVTEMDMGVSGTTYKGMLANDGYLYNGSGNMDILTDAGQMTFTTGGAATPQMILNAVGKLSISNATDGISAISSAAAPVLLYGQATSSSASATSYLENNRGGFASYAGGLYGGSAVATSLFGLTRADKYFVFADGASNLGMAIGTLSNQSLTLGTNNSARMVISNAGAVRMNTYTAGTATFDGSGNITSVSDRRAKHSILPFTYGLSAIKGLKTSSFIYNNDSSNTRMSGFIAQDVQKVIPMAVHKGKDKDGTLSLETNAVLAALVNAVKEQQQQIELLKKEIELLKPVRPKMKTRH